MSPDVLGVIIGTGFIVPTILLIRSKQWDSLAWPLLTGRGLRWQNL